MDSHLLMIDESFRLYFEKQQEQVVICVPFYKAIAALPGPFFNLIPMSTFLSYCSMFRQPVPGMMTFYDFTQVTPLYTATPDYTNTVQRVDYMNKVLCPYWSAGLTAAQRDAYASMTLQQLMDLQNF